MALPYYTRLEIDALLENFQPSGGDTDPAPEPGEGGSVFYFDNYGQFPRPGQADSLYVDNSDGLIYIWDVTINDYKEEGRTQIQSDWNEADNKSPAYIRNKPNDNESFAPFITRWNITAGEEVTLPLVDGNEYDFQVDWGDGTGRQGVSTWNHPNATHTFSEAGVYDISIQGRLGDFHAESFLQITEIVQWGDIEWRKLSFKDCTNLEFIPQTEVPNFLNVNTLRFLFGNTKISVVTPALLEQAKNVTNFELFLRGTLITEIPENFLDNCLSANTFAGAFKSAPITTIPNALFKGTINVKNVAQAFRDCNVNTIPEGIFDTCTVLDNVNGLFFNNSVTGVPLELFKYNKQIKDFAEAFRNCPITSEVPELWLQYPDVASINCFQGADNSPNWSDIPTSWGGINTDPYPYPQEPIGDHQYWDTNLLKPLWRINRTWYDATGTVI